MDVTGSAADFLPQRSSLQTLRAAVQECRGCELCKHATQAVFGEGFRRERDLHVLARALSEG